MGVSGVAEFLARLSSRDPSAASLGQHLLEAGWTVQSISGPQQMDVWELLLRRGTLSVRLGIERGYSDGVLVADLPGAYRPLITAMRLPQDVSGSRGDPLAENPDAVIAWLNQHDGR